MSINEKDMSWRSAEGELHALPHSVWFHTEPNQVLMMSLIGIARGSEQMSRTLLATRVHSQLYVLYINHLRLKYVRTVSARLLQMGLKELHVSQELLGNFVLTVNDPFHVSENNFWVRSCDARLAGTTLVHIGKFSSEVSSGRRE